MVTKLPSKPKQSRLHLYVELSNVNVSADKVKIDNIYHISYNTRHHVQNTQIVYTVYNKELLIKNVEQR